MVVFSRQFRLGIFPKFYQHWHYFSFCTPVNDDGTPFSFVNNNSTPDNAVNNKGMPDNVGTAFNAINNIKTSSNSDTPVRDDSEVYLIQTLWICTHFNLIPVFFYTYIQMILGYYRTLTHYSTHYIL